MGYIQHIAGALNIITDCIFYEFHISDATLTYLLLSLCPCQIPLSSKISDAGCPYLMNLLPGANYVQDQGLKRPTHQKYTCNWEQWCDFLAKCAAMISPEATRHVLRADPHARLLITYAPSLKSVVWGTQAKGSLVTSSSPWGTKLELTPKPTSQPSTKNHSHPQFTTTSSATPTHQYIEPTQYF
eukprot:10749482-Ditylum_brightwellii.AAC.1